MKDESQTGPPARFRHAAFLDLLADAANGYHRAKRESDSYEVSRAARASIVASCLSLECFANCLLDALELQSKFAAEIDKLPALAKIDLYLKLNGNEALDRGNAAVQQATDLMRIRNDYVHPKIMTTSAELKAFEETDSHVTVPFGVTTAYWPAIKIPKQSLVWDSNAAGKALKALASFYSLVLIHKLEASAEDLLRILVSRFEFADFLMPAIYDEYRREINALQKDDIDFSFLKL